MLSFGVFLFLFWCLLLNICTHVNYVNFDTDLYLYSKKRTFLLSTQCFLTSFSLIIVGFLFCECAKEQMLLLVIWAYPNFDNDLLEISLKKLKFHLGLFCGSHTCYLHFRPSCISNLVLFVCKTCSSLVTYYSHCYIKRYSLESWASLSKQFFQFHVMELKLLSKGQFPACSAH